MLLGIALILFAVAAVLGLIFAANYFKNGKLPLGLAAVHGIFAASGLVLLIISVLMGETSTIGIIAMIIFIIAALGGFILLYNHLTKGKLPRQLIAIHAVAAVIAFLILLLGGFKAK
jgi:hypothetical protein